MEVCVCVYVCVCMCVYIFVKEEEEEEEKEKEVEGVEGRKAAGKAEGVVYLDLLFTWVFLFTWGLPIYSGLLLTWVYYSLTASIYLGLLFT